jgi:hypothetical protein
MLATYQVQVRRLLHDATAAFYTDADLTAYINIARTQIAQQGECVRVRTPIAGPIASATVISGGSGYTAPTVVFTGTGSGATGTVTQVGGVVTAVTVTNGGAGFQQPVNVTILDPTGQGARAQAVIPNINNTVVGQEQYTFVSRNPIVALTPGVSSIIKLQSVAVSWGTLKPVLRWWTWNDFQAFFRSYNTMLQNWPSDCAQHGEGGAGVLYLFPLPSQITAMEWDCLCLPLALVDDLTPEAIPPPWTDAVQFYAGYLALSNAQREGGADRMLKIYDMMMKTARKQAEAPFVPDAYAGW